MNLDELFKILDMESIDDFKYFDNFAMLIESDEDISYESMYELLSQIESKLLIELTEDYFEDILEGVAEDETDLYTLIINIKTALKGIMQSAEDERKAVLFTDELFKFRNWYNFETDVVCKSKKTGENKVVSMKDALVLYRLEKLKEEEYFYDFDGCLDYPLDEYTVCLGVDVEEEGFIE